MLSHWLCDTLLLLGEWFARKNGWVNMEVANPHAGQYDIILQGRKAAFLAALSQSGTIRKAAEVVGIQRQSHYDWLNADEDGSYHAAVEIAKLEAAERMEEEARRRAVEGYDSPVYQGGEKVGVIRKYSDLLLIFLLKGALPEKYREAAQFIQDNRTQIVNLSADTLIGALLRQDEAAASAAVDGALELEPGAMIIDVTPAATTELSGEVAPWAPPSPDEETDPS